jgi:hypothetical protein
LYGFKVLTKTYVTYSTQVILEIEHFKQGLALRKKNEAGGEEEDSNSSGEASVFWRRSFVFFLSVP